ncbi:MAG: transglycosylase domain-containing protein [Bacteroidales bacterium]|nr:transglycosylase domain-containing protein [Porphyromonas sp.]MDD6934956.1 transglycosylase domain-containing protein [Bacteroidales bacterium]MDY3102465.1 transglycosylase domain-containing protein [Porphyromonas sp.]
MRRKICKILWIIFGSLWGLTALLFLLIWFGIIGYMPPVEQLQNPIDKYASQLISADGVPLGSYARSGNNRVYSSYRELSPDLVRALIAVEDVRFEDHSGIDARGLLRAIVKRGILRQKGGGGGSTITQQLAKQLYSPKADNVIERLLQKPIEWVIALKLERYYTKEEIICMYLNQFDFLYNAVGIRSAAETYFSKKPSELNLQESAMLIGMCKNPSIYNPILHNDKPWALERRNVVLNQMAKAGFLTEAEADSVSALPLQTKFHRTIQAEGDAPYFREFIRLILTAKKPNKSNYNEWSIGQYAADSIAWENDPLYGWCEKHHKSDGSTYDLYADGLKIYSTVDSRMQRYAEEAVREHVGGFLQPAFTKEKQGSKSAPYSSRVSAREREEMILRAMKQSDRWYQMKKEGASEREILGAFNEKRKMQVWSWGGMVDKTMSPRDSILYYKGLLRSSFMAMNPSNGHVLAYVGGIDFRTFKYDMVNQGRRQVGSTIKPFLYSLLMSEGMSPCDMVLHNPVTLYDGSGRAWTPRSGGARRQGEMVSIRWGLQNSSNWVTAYLMGKTSPVTFVRLLKSYGVTGQIDPVVSLAAGTPDISLAEMVSAYTTFVAQGIRVSPLYVTRIEDQFGNTIESFAPRMTEVLNEEASLKMLDMLQAVVNGGTGGRLRSRFGLDMPLGGKTGTTQNNSDSWFMGFTPEIVAGCWVGGEDRSIHFNSTSIGQGAAAALPVFGKFIKKVYADRTLGYSKDKKFNIPEGFNACGRSGGESNAEEDWWDGEASDLDVGGEADLGGTTSSTPTE